MSNLELYDYQKEGSLWLAQRHRAYLGDEMGLGKTVQAAHAALAEGAKNALVICPAAVRDNWRREWEKWAGTPVTVQSYTSLLTRSPEPGEHDFVIMDEAHYCKNHKAKRTLNALRLAQAADRAWLLSGTPMPNHPGELYPAVAALWPTFLRRLSKTDKPLTYWQWFNLFTRWTNTKYGPRPYATKNKKVLRYILDTIMLRRTLNDVSIQLPPLRVHTQLLEKDTAFVKALEEYGDEAKSLLHAMESEAADERGSTSRLRRFLGEYKAPLIGRQIAQELADNEYQKIVVLAYHRSVITRLAEILEEFDVAIYHGDTSDRLRADAKERFQRGKARVFLGQQTASGTGLNLQAASEVVLVEPDWTPTQNKQAIKRVHRIGQDRPCRARIFAVSSTLDEALMGVIAQKTQMQADAGLGSRR